MELRNMVVLAPRTGRHLQRYHSGRRQVVGCIPYRYKVFNGKKSSNIEEDVEVLVITPQRKGKGMLFPKGGWEADETIVDAALRETVEEAGVLGDLQPILGQWRFNNNKDSSYDVYMFPLLVKQELPIWPEKDKRQRIWMSVPEARKACHYEWMKEALEVLVNRLPSHHNHNNVKLVDQSCDPVDTYNPPTDEETQHSSLPTSQFQDCWKIQALVYPMSSLIEMPKTLKQFRLRISWECHLNNTEKVIQVIIGGLEPVQSLDLYSHAESRSLMILHKPKSLIDEDWDKPNFANQSNFQNLNSTLFMGKKNIDPKAKTRNGICK